MSGLSVLNNVGGEMKYPFRGGGLGVLTMTKQSQKNRTAIDMKHTSMTIGTIGLGRWLNRLLSVCCFIAISPMLLGQTMAMIDTLTRLRYYSFAEIMPEYQGGGIELIKDFSKRLVIPDTKTDDMIQTRINYEYIITKDGRLTGARVKGKDKKNYTDLEVAGLIALAGCQHWKPGKIDGNAVNVLCSTYFIIDHPRDRPSRARSLERRFHATDYE